MKVQRTTVVKFWSRPLGRYIIIGGSVYVIELAVILLAQVAGAGNVTAVAIGFWVGLLISFGLQKVVAFQDTRLHYRVLSFQMLLYSVLVLWNFGFTVLVTQGLRNILPAVVCRTLAIGVTTIWNFYLYKTRIFKSVSTHEVG